MRTAKRNIKLMLRSLDDLTKGHSRKFARKTKIKTRFHHSILLQLEIKKGTSFENKVHNLKLAAESINEVIIRPGEIFSFWKIVGNPDKGFKKSRSIINGELSEETGGGLCQVSGAIYFMSLKSGLQVLERYNHSIDIYTDETRYTPLGTDATVVYGYKDLRIKNNYDFQVRFSFDVQDDVLDLHLQSEEKIQERDLNFSIEKTEKEIISRIKDEDGNVYLSKYKNN